MPGGNQPLDLDEWDLVRFLQNNASLDIKQMPDFLSGLGKNASFA